MSRAPEVEDLVTDRLLLRAWTPDEIDAVLNGGRLAHWASDFPAEGDQVIVGLIAGRPEWLTAWGHRRLVLRDSGVVVGSAGLFWPPEGGALELGYGLVPSARGRGYATEAVRALTAHALTAPDVHTVHARVDRANGPSVRVLERAGFAFASAADEEQPVYTFQASRV